MCPLRSMNTAGSSDTPCSKGGGVVAAVPSLGGALLSPFAELLASLIVDVPPGNCDCQALGTGGCGGFSSSCFWKVSRDRDLDLESFRRPPPLSSLSTGWRLHFMSVQVPEGVDLLVVTFCVCQVALTQEVPLSLLIHDRLRMSSASPYPATCQSSTVFLNQRMLVLTSEAAPPDGVSLSLLGVR